MPVKFSFFSIFPCLLILCTSLVSAAANQDVKIIESRLLDRFVQGIGESWIPEVDLDALKDDGSWPDLDYYEEPYRGQVALKSAPHLYRLKAMTFRWYKESDPEAKAKLGNLIAESLNFWLKTRPQTTHNWFMEIGMPRELARVGILFNEELSEAQRAGIVEILQTSVQEDGSLVYSTKPATGQNLVWEAGLQIVAGCLMEDPEYIARYAQMLEQEIRITTEEGIQHDWSFHQHGALLQSGASYGYVYAYDCAMWANVLRNTAFAFKPSSVDIIVHLVLDGQQWMVYGGVWDFSVMGREPSRADFHPATRLLPALGELRTLAPGRKDEIAAFDARIRQATTDGSPVGARSFWRSDYMVQRTDDYFLSYRMSSVRTLGNESGNGEGAYNYHLGDGVMDLMVDGDEYLGIFPLWDWRKLPGLTAIYAPDIPLPQNIWGRGSEGGGTFVGSTTEGGIGVAAMDFDRGGVSARKAVFAGPKGATFLAAGIDSEDEAHPVLTTLNQCWAHGDTVLSDGQNVGEHEAFQGDWIWHDNVAYIFPEHTPVHFSREMRSEDWKKINNFGPSKKLSGEVFSLWLDHGAAVDNGSYHYEIIPAVDKDDVDELRSALPAVISNTQDLQAVYHQSDRWGQAVFWKAGKVQFAPEVWVEVDHPALVQVRATNDGSWAVAISDPTHLLKAVTIRLGLQGVESAREVQLPHGPFAGQTVVYNIR